MPMYKHKVKYSLSYTFLFIFMEPDFRGINLISIHNVTIKFQTYDHLVLIMAVTILYCPQLIICDSIK